MLRPYSLYDVLSVTPDAQPAVIEAAYRALMKQHHPDRAGVADRAAEINAAYSVLREPQRRAAYDQRQFIRRQAMLNAQAEHLLAPGRFSARAGWIVAALLGLLVAGLAGERYGLTVVPSRTAVAHSPQKQSPPPSATATLGEEIDDALAALALPRSGDTAVAATASVPVALPTTTPAKTGAPDLRPHMPLRRRQARPQPVRHEPPSRGDAAERDFLEREGFIY